MRKRIFAALIAAVIMIACLAGCGAADGGKSGYSENMNGYNANEAVNDNYNDTDSESGLTSATDLSGDKADAVKDNRKLIKNYYIDAESREFDNTIDAIYAKTEALGGYIENSDISGTSYEYERNRRAKLVIRVPAGSVTQFIEQIESVGNVTNYREDVSDVSLNYVDTESHINALKTERDTLMDMLEKADNLDTILAIQNELADVRYELEYYESAIRTLDQQIAYSTVNLELTEVKEITKQHDNETFFQELSRKFIKNAKGMAEFSRNFVIFIISILPILIPPAVIIAIIVVIIVSADKKNRKKAKLKKEAAEKDKK